MLTDSYKLMLHFLWIVLLLFPNTSDAISVKSYSYDKYGNVQDITDPRGFVTQFHYDLINRLERIDYPDSKSVTYSYDLSGIRTKMEDHRGTTLFEPDEFGRITKVTFPDDQTVSYYYDSESNLIKLVYPDRTEVEYTYDLSNRLETVKDSSGVTRFEYDELSNALKKKTLPNGITTEYQYYKTRKISNVIHKKADGILIEEFRYAYDEKGNRTKIEKISSEVNSHVIYIYDKLNRVVKSEHSDGFFEEFSYDGAGNRRSKTTPQGKIVYEYDEENRLRKAGDTVYEYDLAGNLIEKSSPAHKATYKYDFDNRLISYSDETNQVAFEYDGNGNRISKTVNGVCTEYINDLVAPVTQVLLKKVQGCWWKGEKTIRYTYGGSRISQSADGRTQFYLYDSLGRNVSNLVSSSGKVLNTYNYDSFGGSLSEEQNVPNVYKYCGEQFDEETGLIYLRNRYYDPEIGRFISKDPRPGKLDRPSTVNPYCYVENNPVNFIDPLGLEGVSPEAWERVRLHINDLGGLFGGQGWFGHVCLEFPDRNLFQGNYPEGMQSYDQKNINANTATFECLCKSSGVDTALALMTQIKWTLSKNCVYTAVEGMKEMGFIHGEKIHLSKFLPLPSELRSQMLEFHGIDPRIISYPREKIEITHPAPPSPSLGFISSPNLDFGGVSLSKTAELQLNLADITGAAFDPITGQLVLFGPEDRYFPPIDLDDLAVAVRSVYSIGLPCPQDPGVSIGTESSPFAGQMKVRYDGATANTSFGQIMFEADRLLKCLELGKDNISGQAVSANVPGYSSLINRLAAHQFFSQTAVGHRMWFVPDKITLVEAEDHKGMVFSDVRMKVLTESQFNGSPSDVPACREFAEHFTAHFDEFSKQYPILEKLKTLGKITAIVKWIRENNIPFDPSFFINYQPKKIETVAYTPSTESRGEWMVEKTEKHKVPGHKKKTKVAVPYTYSFSASGGVDYRLNSSNFATYVDPLANDFSISALRSRPSEQDFTWTFRSPTNRETFMAAAQSISRTRKPGNVKKSYVDMNFPVPGNQELTLYRFYNSFSEKEAALGRGWRIVPYELEISLEKVILSSQDDKSCETRRAILVRTPDAECFYQPFALSSDNCPVFNSPDYSGLLKDNLNGTFSFYIPRFGRVDFDKGGRLIRTLDTNGFSIEYHYRGDQLVSICHQNGATILLEYEENRLFKAIGPGNTSVYYTYHPDGQLKTVDDVSGPYLRYSYDLDQRLSKITDRLENILFEAAYDDYNRATLIKEGGISYQADFSLEKRVMKVYDHQGRESILKYDEKDKLIYRQDPGGLIWEFEYEQGHVPFPTKIIDPKKGITKCHYDPAGNPIYLKNSAGAEWRFFYDLAGKLVARREPNKRTIWNWYFGVNQQLSQNYANTYLEFDENNLFAQIYTGIQIKGPATYFNYDKITGQLKSRKDTRGGTTSFDYDDHGQLKEISYPMGYAVERKVDEKGKIHEISDGFGLQKSYDYDESGQLKEVRTPLGTTHFTYDKTGDLRLIVDPRNFKTSYDYDNQHNLKIVTDAEGEVSSYEYNSFNQLTHISLPNGSSKTIKYDSVGRLEKEIWGE